MKLGRKFALAPRQAKNCGPSDLFYTVDIHLSISRRASTSFISLAFRLKKFQTLAPTSSKISLGPIKSRAAYDEQEHRHGTHVVDGPPVPPPRHAPPPRPDPLCSSRRVPTSLTCAAPPLSTTSCMASAPRSPSSPTPPLQRHPRHRRASPSMGTWASSGSA
jgi:hypothetical protein